MMLKYFLLAAVCMYFYIPVS